jgi:SAM-dependent methyltransferase
MNSNASGVGSPDPVSGRDAIRAAYQDDERAGDYIRSRYEDDPFGRATHEHQVRVLARLITSLGARRVLEVATGPARLTVHVPRLEQGVGVEQSLAMIRRAEERLRACGRDDWRLEQGDAFELPYKSGEFDLAMSFKLVRHFERPERIRLLTNLRAAVRPGGHVVIDVPNDVAYRWLYRKWGVKRGWIDDYWLTPDQFQDEASEAGFSDVRLKPIQPLITAQYYCWSYLWRASPAASRALGRALEVAPWGEPLEWMAVCRCG